MDKTRIFTGLALSVIAVCVILYLSTIWFALVGLALVLFGSSEWAALAGLRGILVQGGYAAVTVALAGLAWWSVEAGWEWLPVTIGVVWWIGAAASLATWRTRWSGSTTNLRLQVAGLFALVPAWISVVLIHRYDPWLMLFLVVLGASGDSAAYFTGKRFGRRRLAPHLSPGKTWEGLMGELAMGLVIALIGALVFAADNPVAWILFVALTMVTIIASVFGDLFESMLKRIAGSKDSGDLLPGHGGILDRIDSHLAAAPVFMLGLMFLHGGYIT
ncbi:phosphatidate cytidylyltransferase [Acidihalobacter ferrooxydans]|uniref:Phosphatidate cytidylyltransferase n=1 Tax=Acidihalobacter ferrooxydans TaxID=1765967 RepID=A0A1P8UHI5_9GAMM|nr:phosphatidate cytidylyltransferase [Acidihalobacter ferrooxydans]APZ43234.1 hypothetical protein BW247_09130 [Acidihalobacter ferrooxydans]